MGVTAVRARTALIARTGPIAAWSTRFGAMGASATRCCVQELEACGLRMLWISESTSKEVFALATMLLGWTTELIIATGIANIWARDPMAMANGARTLAEAYPGRFVLGVGVSHQSRVEARGHAYRSPVQHLDAYLRAMSEAPYSGPQPAQHPSVIVGALGPSMLRLAAEATAGAHTYFVPTEHTSFARSTLGEAALLVTEQAVVLEEDPVWARRQARDHMHHYLALPNYVRNLARLGWDERHLADGGSDELVDAIVVWGDHRAVRQRVDEHLAAGADQVALQLLGASNGAEPIDAWRSLVGHLV